MIPLAILVALAFLSIGAPAAAVGALCGLAVRLAFRLFTNLRNRRS